MSKEPENGFSRWEIGLLLLCFLVCLTGALILPMNMCPDESGRVLLSRWMGNTHTLPAGSEMDVIIMNRTAQNTLDPSAQHWGFSYALRPFLASMVGAACEIVCGWFTDNPAVLLAASRMCSVLSVTLCCWYCLKLGRRSFPSPHCSFFFAAFVCFLPQVQFLGMYQNNDALSLCAVSAMLYYLVEGYDNHWKTASCVKLAIALSAGALSYYISYPWYLMGLVFCVVSVLRDREISFKGRFLLQRAALIGTICLVLAGWFFIRNALLHQGDFLGMAEELRSRERIAALGYRLYEYRCARNEGVSFLASLREGNGWFFQMTIMSVYGVFGYLDILMPNWLYNAYYSLTVTGLLVFFVTLLRRRLSGRDRLLILTGLIAGAMVFALHAWHSYARDFQPQGRYIITLALPVGWMIARGLDVLQDRLQSGDGRIALAAGCGWLALFIMSAVTTMSKMLLPH